MTATATHQADLCLLAEAQFSQVESLFVAIAKLSDNRDHVVTLSGIGMQLSRDHAEAMAAEITHES